MFQARQADRRRGGHRPQTDLVKLVKNGSHPILLGGLLLGRLHRRLAMQHLEGLL